MSSTQVKVALHKQAHPEKYCPHPRCLWHTGGGLCPRHGGGKEKKVEQTRFGTS